MQDNKYISIVVPVYNEADNLEHFYEETTKVMQTMNYDYELVFVDDGSKDTSLMILHELAKQDDHVAFIMLSRNFGHQIALSCGLENAKGDAVITMDGDMQHPPTLIPELIKKWEEGYEVVMTVRRETVGASFLKNFTSNLYYKIINIVSQIEIVPGGSDFRLLDKKVVEAFCLYKERARFIRGLISTFGFNQCRVDFVAPPRFAGKSKYSLKKMFHFALDGITSFSKTPLRFAFYIGLFSGMVSFILTMHVLFIKLFTEEAVPGWTTITASISLFGGLQLVGLGIVGEYVGRIFEEVKQRPLYLISKKVGKKF